MSDAEHFRQKQPAQIALRKKPLDPLTRERLQGLAADYLSKQSSWKVAAKQRRPILIRPNRFRTVCF